MDVLPWSRHHRLFPGQGSFDLTGFLGHVLAAGYAGPWSLEVFNDVFRQADPRGTAIDARRSLLALEEVDRRAYRPWLPPALRGTAASSSSPSTPSAAEVATPCTGSASTAPAGTAASR